MLKTATVVTAVSVITAVGLLVAGGHDPALARSGSPPAAGGEARALVHRFPDVRLRTADNRDVRFYDDLVKGKLVLINFMFTSCKSLCPQGTENLVKVQRLLGERMGRDVFLISISIDPDRDTPAALKRYAKRYGAGPGWVFATGRADDVTEIRRKLGDYDPADPSPHTGMVLYGNDATGSWARMPITSSPTTIVSSALRLLPQRKAARSEQW